MGLAAGVDEFYERLYARGMADFKTADYQLAYDEFHKAAFGFVDQIEKFETAEVYAAIAANRLGHEGETRDALLRIAAAESIEPHLASITISDALRAELYRAAATLLTKKEAAVLGVPQQIQDAASKEKPRVTVPTPGEKPNVAETAPRGAGEANAPDSNSEAQPIAPKPSPTPAPSSAADPPPKTSATSTSDPAPPHDPTPVASDPPPHNPTPAASDPVSHDPSPAETQEDGGTQPAAGAKQTTVPMLPPIAPPAEKMFDTRLDEAQKAADEGNPDRARSIYNALLRGPRLPHASALRLTEGLYRVRDFAGVSRAFRRAGVIAEGEERFHYYEAVALFETGHYADARRELDLALPFIEMTESVTSYREKISRATK